jgi:DNA-binding SARP family transcriptional activator
VSQASDLPHLQLVCFGAPTARLAGRDAPADVLWRKHLGLLIYLALSPERARTRDHLVGLLWPEKPEQQARHSLNEAVRRLRVGLGAGRLRTQGELVLLHDAALDVDVQDFAALAGERPAEATKLLRGDFLEGFVVDDAPAFEDWAARERTRWRARGAAVLVSAGEAALAAGRLAEAEDAALRALALEPHGEPGIRLRLRALALRGDPGAALAAYHEFVDRLATEFAERPGRELEALAERIRGRAWRPKAAPLEEAPVPLVGDSAAHRRAFGVIGEALAGAPRTLAIVAAPGFGKTRLVGECIARAALDGAATVVATPLENDYDAPWSTLRALARAGLAAVPGVAATPPEALAVLGAVVPELGGPAVRAPTDRGEVAAALARLLAATAEERPLVVAVDDAHFADGATVEALGAAWADVGRAPLALVFSCVPEAEQGPAALVRLRAEVGRRLPGDCVRLGALSAEDVGELVAALAPWCGDDDRRERLTRRLMFETGGSPFLAVTLLQALARAATMREDVLAWPRRGATIESPLPISVPDLVRMAVVARVSALASEDLQLIRAASVCGSGIDVDVIRRTTGLDAAALEEGLTRLERAGLIASDGQRYAFAAPLIADVVRSECLTAGQRRALRQRTADALIGREDMDARVLRVELQADLDPDAAVVDDALRIAQSALEAGALRSARRALAAADQSAGASGAGDQRGRLAELRGRLAGSQSKP